MEGRDADGSPRADPFPKPSANPQRADRRGLDDGQAERDRIVDKPGIVLGLRRNRRMGNAGLCQRVRSQGGGKDMGNLFRRVRHARVTGILHAWSAVRGSRRSGTGVQRAPAGETGTDLAMQQTGETVLAEAAELAEIEHKMLAEHQDTAEEAKTVPRPRQPLPVDYL